MSRPRAGAPDDAVRLAYRPDIDGLRAVAVLAVLAYHAFPALAPGGFVGVDVFFVISGFLITGLIRTGLAAGRFTVAGFYAARVRRIFPALVVVLLAVLALGWHALLPAEFRSLGTHVASGAAFFANVTLWWEAGYFDVASALKPLLHLWSLGIEEQFYLAWPLLLVFAHARPRWLPRLLAGLGVASLALGLALTPAHPDAAFYLPFPRGWELLAGAWLACRDTGPSGGRRGTFSPNVLAGIGLVLIAVAIATFDAATPYPGWHAVLPVAGTVALVAAGPGAWTNRRLLSSRIAVGIGLVSYPLYLWHWPLLSFLRIVEPAPSPARIAGAVVLAFVLAWLTYRLVELPIRRRRARPVPLLLAMAAVAVAGGLAAAGTLRPWSASFGLERIVSLPRDPAFPGPHLHPFPYDISLFHRQGGAGPVTLFIGDSTIEGYYARIDHLLQSRPASTRAVVFANAPGCAPIPGVDEPRRRRWCGRYMRNAFGYAASAEVDTVLIAANWQLYFANADAAFDYGISDDAGRHSLGRDPGGAPRALAALQAQIVRLRAAGKTVHVVLNLPVGEAMAPTRLVERSLAHGFVVRPTILDRHGLVADFGDAGEPLRASAQRAGAHVIDPMDTLCTATTCAALTPTGDPKFKDASHLRHDYAREHATFLDGALPD